MRTILLAAVAMAPALVCGQSPAFEVADIKPSDPSVMKMGKGRMLPGGRIEVPGYTLRELIMFTYGVTDDMISGGPKWTGEDRFDIVAKAPDGAPDTALRLMMKTLLAERFRLVTRSEEKPMSAYALTVAKNAQPLKPGSGGGASQCHWTALEGALRRRECQNMTMAEFAKTLPQTGGIGIDLPVADETGMTGNYDLQFEVGPEPDGPTIFAALQKAGLRLESKKIPVQTMVIESAEKPSGN